MPWRSDPAILAANSELLSLLAQVLDTGKPFVFAPPERPSQLKYHQNKLYELLQNTDDWPEHGYAGMKAGLVIKVVGRGPEQHIEVHRAGSRVEVAMDIKRHAPSSGVAAALESALPFIPLVDAFAASGNPLGSISWYAHPEELPSMSVAYAEKLHGLQAEHAEPELHGDRLQYTLTLRRPPEKGAWSVFDEPK